MKRNHSMANVFAHSKKGFTMIAATNDWYLQTLEKIYEDYSEDQIIELEDC